MRQRTGIAALLLFLLIGLVTLAVAREVPAGSERGDWAAPLGEMDRALGRGDGPAAAAAWREAYVAAHVSRDWPGMLAVGDAALRAGRAAGTPETYLPRARRAYLTALLRARRQASQDGVLAAAAAFGRLGDREVERQARAEAARLARGAETARARARAF
jgi:hypothetical protein